LERSESPQVTPRQLPRNKLAEKSNSKPLFLANRACFFFNISNSQKIL
jgi:hypothetical protein